MAVFSGKNGKVTITNTDITDTASWNLNVETELSEYGSNATTPWKAQVAGMSRWNGDFKMFAEGGAPPITAGTSYTIKLYENASQYWTGTAFIEKVAPKVDIETGKPVEYGVSFKGSGSLTAPT